MPEILSIYHKFAKIIFFTKTKEKVPTIRNFHYIHTETCEILGGDMKSFNGNCVISGNYNNISEVVEFPIFAKKFWKLWNFWYTVRENCSFFSCIIFSRITDSIKKLSDKIYTYTKVMLYIRIQNKLGWLHNFIFSVSNVSCMCWFPMFLHL